MFDSSSSANIAIRPAATRDIPALGELGALLVRTHHDFDAKRFIAPTPGTPSGYGSYLGSLLQSPDISVLVAEENGDVIGYAYAGLEGRDYMSLRGPAGVLYDIVVDPRRRRNGAGRLLLSATLGFLKSRGALQVVLSTATQNEPAQRLFASTGFRPTMIEMTMDFDPVR